MVVAVVDMRVKLKPDDGEGIGRVARVVKEGGLIIYPTETVYGIGCDPFNQPAVDRVSALKGRERKAFPVLVSGITKADRLVAVGDVARLLMKAFWPGALTIVLEAKPGASGLGHGTGKIGVRMPRHELALGIIRACGGALVGTSANVSGMQPARRVEELDPRIEGGVDLVVDGGPSELGLASTVLEVLEGKGKENRACARLSMLRRGALGIDAIKREASHWRGEGIEVEIV